MTMTARSPTRSAGSMCGRLRPNGPCAPSRCVLNPREKLKLPPISPASKPTRASRAHCPKRKGWISCRFVCSKASVIVSTAEIGKRHLGGKQLNSKVQRNQDAGQINLSLGDLLVAQRFDGIELRGSQSRDEPADDANHQQNYRRKSDCRERNSEMNIALSGIILEQRPHHRQGADSPGNQ